MRKTQQKNPPKRKVGMVTEAERLNERAKAVIALAEMKKLEHKYRHQLITKHTERGYIRALPQTMKIIEQYEQS